MKCEQSVCWIIVSRLLDLMWSMFETRWPNVYFLMTRVFVKVSLYKLKVNRLCFSSLVVQADQLCKQGSTVTSVETHDPVKPVDDFKFARLRIRTRLYVGVLIYSCAPMLRLSLFGFEVGSFNQDDISRDRFFSRCIVRMRIVVPDNLFWPRKYKYT